MKTTNSPMRNDIPIQRYTHQELATFYKVSWITLQKWLKKIERDTGPKIGHFYTARQVIIIFERLGFPTKTT